ncbi:MAG: hypothetical protein ACQEWV_07315 [Bacillota bacterium]
MLKRVIVFGVHSYIGFGLSERLLNEGVEVKGILLMPKNRINKQLVEERLMMVGRNALFQTKECCERTNDDDDSVDMIIYCCEDGVESSLIEQDRKNVMKSVELAKELNVPYVFISPRNKTDNGLRKDHIKFCELYLNENLETRTLIQLPILFGPFQPPSERIHQFLVNYVNGQENVLIVDEPILFIQDAVDAIWDLLGKVEKGKSYSFLSELKQEKESSFLIEVQLNLDIAKDDRNEKYLIKEPTTIEKGLEAQVAFIEKYRDILIM